MNIKPDSTHHVNNQQAADDNMDFNELVLMHIKETQPDGTLNELLDEMKALSPDKPCTMQQLNSALLYSDATLRTDPDYMDYTTEILDKRTTQLSGVNMLVGNMLYKLFRQPDEDNDVI